MAMSKKLYNLMDWAEIEAVTYSEEDHPKAVLGAHPVRGGQTLVTAYLPEAKKVELKLKGEKNAIPMELADEEGYFAILAKNREPFEYTFLVTGEEGEKKEIHDPYAFPGVITKRDVQKFNAGVHYRAYEILGAHPMKLGGVSGVHFAVWAPNAMRVSVVGDFNGWDGRLHQMERLWESGIFELFVPEAQAGQRYKFEIKLRSGICLVKADPYAAEVEAEGDGASVVADLTDFAFTDDEWIEHRDKVQGRKLPVAVLEADLSEKLSEKDGKKSFDPKKAAAEIVSEAERYGFTHVSVSNVFDAAESFYSPASVYGGARGLMVFINELHKKKLGVILEYNAARFPNTSSGLAQYDGSCLYEDADPKRSSYPEGDNRYFNLGRSEVRNFLIANALYLVSVFHADGLKVTNMARILYLDYGKQSGEWTPNMYGGNENLDAMDFFRDLNTVLRKMSSDVLTVADDESAFPNVTADQQEEGMGFTFKLNAGWNRDVLGYLRYDPLSRSNHYNELCFPMLYQYNESFILPLSSGTSGTGLKGIFEQMAGDYDEKFSGLRSLLSYFFFHPGKKLLFPGEAIGEKVDERLLLCEKDLLKLYRSEAALFELDDEGEGFEWINNISANENIIVFARKSSKKNDILVCLANFQSVPRKEYKIGVPAAGKYTEIFNSDEEKYGGFGFTNPKALLSVKDECDGREDSIRVKVAPMGVSLFRFSPAK